MKLSDTEFKALRAFNRSKDPMTCNELGWELWGERRLGGGGSNPFSRPAGRVLHRLLRRGLVFRKWNNNRLEWSTTLLGYYAVHGKKKRKGK